MKYRAKVKDGAIRFATPYAQAFFFQRTEGKTVSIEVKKSVPSDELRGYYFAAVVPTVRATVKEWDKLSDDDVHEALKKMFNFFDFWNPITKRAERVGRSAMSDDSNTERAMAFLERIRVWLAEDYMTEMPSPEEYKRERDTIDTV